MKLIAEGRTNQQIAERLVISLATAKTHVHNKAAVAVANKMARIVWAVWSRLEPYGSVRQAA